MHVVQLNYAFDPALSDPEALLDAYHTLTGWSDAVAAAGADGVTVVQRWPRTARAERNGIAYQFCRRSDLHRVVDAARPDVVHVNGLIFAASAWLLRRRLPSSTAMIMQDHGGGIPGRLLGARRPITLRLLRAADALLFSTIEQADAWRQAGLLPPEPRVWDVMEASTTLRAMPRDEARRITGLCGSPALLWVGRLNANKDPITVLDGFAHALPKLRDATLTMVYGDEELLPAVRDRIAQSSELRARVHLIGHVSRDRLSAFYSAADLFVSGSRQEGSGYALLEACACGVTPIVTDIPSFRAITNRGSYGALWTPGDSDAFASAVVKAWDQHAHASSNRSRMSDYFERELSWRAIGQRAVGIYRDVLAARREWLATASR
jgi:glycosyltransferase involved in cell wall biosynthesis